MKNFVLPILILAAISLHAQQPARENHDPGTEKEDKSPVVPHQINFQGRLHDNDGNPVEGSRTVVFSLYATPAGGTALWTETRTVQFVDGLFGVSLGEVTPLDAPVFSSAERWLGIKIGTDAEMTPRTRISSVGYAMQTDENDPTWEGTANTTGNISRMGAVGIGTETPVAPLHIVGLGTGEGNVLFEGQFNNDNPGDPPISGDGTRMMWYPDKAAFRAGHLSSFGAAKWDKDSIGTYSFAVGLNTKALGNSSIAMGLSATASGNYSTSIGYHTTASGTYSIAKGYLSKASASASTAMGYWSEASGVGSTAMGWVVIASGGSSTATGNYTKASGTSSTAMGFWSEASGTSSTAMGSNTIASGNYSTSMGGSTTASGYISTAMGGLTIASASYSTAMGRETTAAGSHSTAMGYLSEASAGYSTAMGRETTASGSHSTAMGYLSEASGYYSTAMGRETTASAFYSTAMGRKTTASGMGSTVMGENAIASGLYSTAMGRETNASGHMSTAMGSHTIARSAYETALGWYNTNFSPFSHNSWNNNDRLFVIGNGTTEENRSDAFMILKSGNTGIRGPANTGMELTIHCAYNNRKIEFTSDEFDPIIQPDIDAFGQLGLANRKWWRAYVNTYFGVNTSIQSISDQRYKRNIRPMDSSISKLMELNPVSYDLIPEKLSSDSEAVGRYKDNDLINQMGFLAQDVQKIFPQLVKPLDDESDVLTLGYSGLIPVMIKGMQEQQEIIQNQQQTIHTQQQMIDALLRRVEALEAR